MATYTPKLLRTTTAITASAASVYTPSGVTGIIRTFIFQTLTAHSVSLSINTDAAGTRFVDGYLLTINVPWIQNVWLVIPDTIPVQVKADSIASNAPTFSASGYEYV